MKLINREQALSHPFANDKYDHINAKKDFIRGFESYKEWLENLPTIDLVRCKDCKHSKECIYPAKWNWCPDGERRIDESNTKRD